jgi:hypothetical protein
LYRRGRHLGEFEYSHAAILVSDIERSAQFYERASSREQEFSGNFDDSIGRAKIGGPISSSSPAKPSARQLEG